MANRNFDFRQSLERQIKSIFLKATYAPTAATVTLPTTTPIVLTKAAANSLYNGHTYQLAIAAAAANPTDTVLAVWTGTAAAAVLTITPNDGTNNPTTQASGSLATTTPIVLTKTVAAQPGVAGNTKTVTLEVEAAAANPGDTVLAVVTGTAAATIITITPNDGTNNAATPVPLTTAELVEWINSGAVVGKTVTTTDVGGLRDDQTATGGDATNLADAGEGDGLVCTFTGGANTAVTLTTAELAELIDTGVVAGKTVTVTDVGGLLNDQDATGGDATPVVAAGEGDALTATFAGGANTAVSLTTAEVVELINSGVVAGKTVTVTDGSSLRVTSTATGGGTEEVADGGEGDLTAQTFAGAIDFTLDNAYGIYSVGLTAVGTIRVTFVDKYYALKFVDAIVLDATARDFTTQIKALDVNPTSGRAYVDIYTLTGATATTLPVSSKLLATFDLKNTSAIV